jgi:5-methylcytosine-specific restriction endonuclease McrA
MEFKCSLCEYKSSRKSHIIQHNNRKIKCNDGIPEILTVEIDIKCEYCENSFTLKKNLIRHQKTCKVKKFNQDEEIRILKEKLAISEASKKSNNVIEYNFELQKKYNKLEETIESMVKLVDKKVLGNTNVEIIRSQARKLYKKFSNNLNCVHCNHSDNIQVCHIKSISDFNKLSTIEEINNISNLIGLCPNCHSDLDKSKKFEVTRTAILHSFLVKCIKN